MGSELSCPCGDRNDIEKEEPPKMNTDIVKEVMRGKLLPEELLYEYTYDQSKVCLIRTDQLEGFFANRNLLKLSTKKEINYYYNITYITNFLGKNDLVFVLLQYTPGMEDKSFNRSSSFFNTGNSYISSGQSKKKRSTNKSLDYSANYKVEKVNLVSNEKSKVIEHILNDLNSKVKKDFLFYGIVNDFDNEETPGSNTKQEIEFNLKSSTNSISNKFYSPRTFKILYKRA
jgi:hypothetical protein